MVENGPHRTLAHWLCLLLCMVTTLSVRSAALPSTEKEQTESRISGISDNQLFLLLRAAEKVEQLEARVSRLESSLASCL